MSWKNRKYFSDFTEIVVNLKECKEIQEILMWFVRIWKNTIKQS